MGSGLSSYMDKRDPIEVSGIRLLGAIVFFLPSLAIMWVFDRLWVGCFRLVRRLYGQGGGYVFKLGLKLRKHAHIIGRNVLVESLQFAVNRTEQENIMKAIDTKTPHEFVPKCDQGLPPEEQTKFMVTYIDAYYEAKLADDVYQVKGMGTSRKETIKSGTQQNEVLKRCLKGWKNFIDESGNQVTFNDGDSDDDKMSNINKIPPAVRKEITQHIKGESEADEGE